jgi:hypothetical protein
MADPKAAQNGTYRFGKPPESLKSIVNTAIRIATDLRIMSYNLPESNGVHKLSLRSATPSGLRDLAHRLSRPGVTPVGARRCSR